jgi:hypothetical protein
MANSNMTATSDRQKTRNDSFTGSEGKFNTTFNTLVRLKGMEEANTLRKDKSFYKELNFEISNLANKSYRNGENVRHPKFKIPAFYGMKSDMYETLSSQRKAYVSAYKTEWLNKTVTSILEEYGLI